MFNKNLRKVVGSLAGVTGAVVWANTDIKPKSINMQVPHFGYQAHRSGTFFAECLAASRFPIPRPHEVSPVFEQSLAAWAESSTKKFQLLDFAPSDLTIKVAFLRLLGVEKVSLDHLGRERGSKGCFIRNLPLVEDAHPFILTSEEDILNSIEELSGSNHHHLKSLYAGVPDPIAHIKPTIVNGVKIILNTHELEHFYKIMSQLSDEDITEVEHHLLMNESNPQHIQLLLDNLKKARTACQDYMAAFTDDAAQNLSRRP